MGELLLDPDFLGYDFELEARLVGCVLRGGTLGVDSTEWRDPWWMGETDAISEIKTRKTFAQRKMESVTNEQRWRKCQQTIAERRLEEDRKRWRAQYWKRVQQEKVEQYRLSVERERREREAMEAARWAEWKKQHDADVALYMRLQGHKPVAI